MTVGNRKKSKFGNRKVLYRGEQFDSILERNRHIALEDFQKQGIIDDLKRQVEFQLTAHGKPICKMRLDHVYRVVKTGKPAFEDSKGVVTDSWAIKRKLFEAQTGERIQIIKQADLNRKPE